jgi:hypothetical protein
MTGNRRSRTATRWTMGTSCPERNVLAAFFASGELPGTSKYLLVWATSHAPQ